MAKVAAQCAVKLAKGEKIEKAMMKKTQEDIWVPYWVLPPTAVTAENMDKVIVDFGFHLRDEVYLNVEK